MKIKHQKKISIAGVVIVFLATFFSAIILAEQKRSETADWKTYTSSKMGFSIKCPSDFKAFLEVKGDEFCKKRGKKAY